MEEADAVRLGHEVEADIAEEHLMLAMEEERLLRIALERSGLRRAGGQTMERVDTLKRKRRAAQVLESQACIPRW